MEKSMLLTALIIYLTLINMIAFFVYRNDKKRAVKEKYRIPESTLLFLAFIGGSVGALASMKVNHHKTKKIKFTVGIPLIIVLHAVIIVGAWRA